MPTRARCCEDRIAALREANIYERQRYRHLLGIPLVQKVDADGAEAGTPFVVTRIMATGQTEVFATGVYQDRFVQAGRPAQAAVARGACATAR